MIYNSFTRHAPRDKSFTVMIQFSPMLYLIGGAPRVGKSTLASLILKKSKIAHVDTDWIIQMLMFASPQSGIKTYTQFNLHEFKNKALNFYPFLYQFIKYNQPVVEKYVIEGDGFLPEHVAKLQKEFQIKACFLGFSNLQPEILLNNPSKNNWIKNLNSQQLVELCNLIIDVSNYIAKECDLYKIKYFDLTVNYKEQMEKVYRYLLNKNLT